ncbi:dTDP-4-dehydrorhamnose reductase [Actibacterium pelagium]|uniref:dTDP-4-dehydrorhamnose reductase n=1 Tax=Actibacterium pelagium TaxID=2029103 RepID=A0A917EK42_9RHOB|nr:dTDP-4-dehydrorhamnose reductase [Actibacterium pelagium]GGE51737.1 NAD(P)-dependent oxidoreductase [Actibacterium pelagium]
MKALVFGKTGQVAQELHRLLPDAVYLGRDQADLTNPEVCVAAIQGAEVDVVINAAAYTAVDKAEEDEATAALINGQAPGAMAEACAVKNIPFLHISTDYVFDGSGEQPRSVDDPVAPLGAYGWTKLAGERAVEAAGGRHAILRTSWVFSAHGNNFLKTMLRLSETRDALSIVADQIGGPTPAAEIASALVEMAKSMVAGQGGQGIYHFSGAPDVSWANFATEIFRQAGRKVTVTDILSSDYPTPAKRPLNSRLDCRRIETDFDIQRPDWAAGVGCILKELQVI